MTVIGLGTQDSFAEAQDFRDTYGTTGFTMLWDPSFESWAQLGIAGQPAGILTTADGTLFAQWSGAIPEQDVLDLLGEMA